MAKCEWCGKITDNLNKHKDALDMEHSICDSCLDTVNNCECRKCGATVDPQFMINGLCINCAQVETNLRSKKKEEVRLGVSAENISAIMSDVQFTDQDYEKWVTLGNTFSPNDLGIKELRRLWIIVKLNATGIYDNNVISKNFAAIETLLDRNLSKLINNKCKIVIGDTAESRKVVRQLQSEYDIIDNEDAVYIFKV